VNIFEDVYKDTKTKDKLKCVTDAYQKGCYWEGLKCADVDKKAETLLKLRVGEQYYTNLEKQYQITFSLEEDFFDYQSTTNTGTTDCYVPVFSLPPPNPTSSGSSSQDLK